jgi:TRAP-type C4-dicarboxylate transport system permease small subunit
MKNLPNNAFLSLIAGFINMASFLSKAGAVLACLLMAGMTLHVILEIFLRSAMSTSTFVLDEFVGYGVAAMTFLTLGYAFESNTLIRVNILLTKLRSDLSRRIVEVLCVLAAIVLSSYICLYFWKSVERNIQRGSTSETIAAVPLWIPEAFVLAGLVIFILQMIAYILKIVTGHRLLADNK